MTRRRRRVFYRTPQDRAKLWDRKMRGDVYSMILENVKPMAKELFTEYQHTHEMLISMVKDVLKKHGEEYGRTQYYTWYIQRLWYLTQRYKGPALQREADATFLFYLYRGGKEEVLREIAARLGITISSLKDIAENLGIKTEVQAEVSALLTTVHVNDDYDAKKFEYVLVDASLKSITITLPPNEKDVQVGIKKIDSSTNVVSIVPQSGSIDGQSSLTIDTQYEAYLLICDGDNWWIM